MSARYWSYSLLFMVAGVALTACTEPATRVVIRAHVDADSTVRDKVSDVEARIESRKDSSSGWQTLQPARFYPKGFDDWPLQLKWDEPEAPGPETTYQLVAVARDSRGALLAQVRVFTTLERAQRDGLRVMFEASCLELTDPCGPGNTCSGGKCISAEYDPNRKRTPDATRSDATTQEPPQSEPKPSAAGVATENAPCESDGDRRCSGIGSSLPLLCQGGTWTRQVECTAAQRCRTAEGPNRGKCEPIPMVCVGQQPEVRFCSNEMMFECSQDLLTFKPRTCPDNERCAQGTEGAMCACNPGFARTKGVACEQSTSCAQANGGCDPLTTCRPTANGRECGECPSGWTGTGDTGCVPALMDLAITGADLTPPFNPGTTQYRARVSLLAQRATLTAKAPQSSEITFNGVPVANGEAWTSPLLTLGENTIEVVASSGIAVTKNYRVVIERTGTEEARIKASNTGANDFFATSIALDGDTLVVGAALEDSAATGVNGDQANDAAADSGAAYVFVRRAGQWAQEAYLKPTNTKARDYFGSAVAISGDTLAIGAGRQDTRSLRQEGATAGSVYVFTRSNGVWSQQAELRPTNVNSPDAFGSALALQKDTLVVGAGLDGGVLVATGAAYVFTRSGSNWSAPLRITPREPHTFSLFGSQVAVSGDTLAITAQEDGATTARGGAVYMFTRNGDRWIEQQRLVQDPQSEAALFGFSVALRGDLLVAGAPHLDAQNSNAPPGTVSVFERSGDRWAQTALLKNPLDARNDQFGYSVSLGDGVLGIGATYENGSSRGLGGDPTQQDARRSGAAYLFAKTPEGWKFSTYLKASNTGADDNFGGTIALSNGTVAVGALTEDGSGKGINPTADDNASESAGSVYVFH